MQVNVTGYQIKDLISAAKKPLVVLNPVFDAEQASLAAALIEIFESYKKQPVLVSKGELPVAVKPLVKPEQQKETVKPKSLVLSLDWVASGLENINYELEGNKFNLIIHSRGKKIAPEAISFAHRGESFDLIVTVGINKVEDLVALGIDNDTVVTTPTINFSTQVSNTNFAKLNVVNNETDSLCALAASVFKDAQLALPTRAADALLFGMRTKTDNFTKVADPQTFEAAAFCKRSMIPGLAQVEKEQKEPERKAPSEEPQPEGWLSPKIFRSGRAS